jgi:hypothetical protein
MLKQRIDSALVALLIAALPALMLTEIRQASAVFYALLVVCLLVCFSRAGGIRATLAELRHYRGLGLALGYWALMVLIAMLTSSGNHVAELERGLEEAGGTGRFGVLGIGRGTEQVARAVALWVEVDDQRAPAGGGRDGGQVAGDGGLAHATLLIENNAPHPASCVLQQPRLCAATKLPPMMPR